MRTLKAVLSGFVVTNALFLAAGLAFNALSGSNASNEYYSPTLSTAFVILLYSGAGVLAGAYIATRIRDSSETLGGFIVAQIFFGFGLIREFWNTGSSWYSVMALLLVIPCAILGRRLARRLGSDKLPRPA